ncbi:MAG TPA: hypothetical protein PKC28_07470 [Bdellovibrionales bacterium]|nr:hypothetical protein [Bdellovibrionales bacterium]
MNEAAVVLVLFLVFAGFGGYLFLMVYYPEWVGITGNAAKKTLSEHEEGSKVDDSDPFSSNTQNKP